MSENYNNPDLYKSDCSCKKFKYVFLLGLKQKMLDYVLTYRDIALVILKINSENMLLNIL